MKIENAKEFASNMINSMHTKIENIKMSETYKKIFGKASEVFNRMKERMTSDDFGKSVLNAFAGKLFCEFCKIFENCKWFKNSENCGKVRKFFNAILRIICTIGTLAFAGYAIKLAIAIIPTIISFCATIFGIAIITKLIIKMVKIAMPQTENA